MRIAHFPLVQVENSGCGALGEGAGKYQYEPSNCLFYSTPNLLKMGELTHLEVGYAPNHDSAKKALNGS